MITVRAKIRAALGSSTMNVAEVARVSGLSAASWRLGEWQQCLRTGEVSYTKIPGAFGRYALREPGSVYKGNMKQLESKLHQLTVNRERLRAMGISLIDSIIDDFEFFKSEFGLKKKD